LPMMALRIVRGSPSMVNGVGLRFPSLRGSWVQIPPPALESGYNFAKRWTPPEDCISSSREVCIRHPTSVAHLTPAVFFKVSPTYSEEGKSNTDASRPVP